MTAVPMPQVPPNTPVVYGPGMLLDQKYYLLEPLYIPCFEGEYFTCTDKKQVFTVKIYKALSSTSPLAKAAFSKITSPFVGKILETGKENERAYEILPYFKNGKLLGKPLTLDFIKKGLVPSINEAIHSLHTWGIMHKDIRPTHFMFLDNWTGAVLIDCGNSGGNLPYACKGRSPEYAAPETFQQLYLPESDYYSFGVTLFELCCGYHPFQGLTREQLAQSRDISLCPMPDTVPPELKQLITGLTYCDISSRQDKTSTNRRWTYDEVKNWTMGKSQVTPTYQVALPSYTFCNLKYQDLPPLITALAKNWELGKQELFLGRMDHFFQQAFPDYYPCCDEIRQEYKANKTQGDILFWRFLYQMHPGLLGFYWKDKVYASFSELGREIIKHLRVGNTSQSDFWEDILKEQLLSQYLQLAEQDYPYLVDGVTALEISHSISTSTPRNQLFHYYTMGFLLSQEIFFCVEKETFKTPDELYLYMVQLIQTSFTDFERFCSHLMDTDDVLDVQLESWLISLGNDAPLDNWKQQISEEEEDEFPLY